MAPFTVPSQDDHAICKQIWRAPTLINLHAILQRQPACLPTSTSPAVSASVVDTKRSPQAGFTLLELMIVVVLIAILAAIAIPSFMRESNKVKGEAEVQPFLTEIANKQEAFSQGNGVYLSVATWAPVAPNALTAHKQSFVQPADWAPLRISPPNETTRCTFITHAGDSSAPAGPLADAELAACGISYDPPPVNYYYVLANCDLNGNGVQSCYMISSDSTALVKIRSGE